jgi:Amino acid permease
MAGFLGINQAIWYTYWTLFCEMGHYHSHDSSSACGRRVQLQYVVDFVMISVLILAVVDLQSYPAAAFNFTLAVGLYILRFRRKRLNIPRSQFRAWDVVVIFNIIVNVYLLIMPWYPPAAGRNGGDVSFWYAAYVVTGIGM